MNVVFEDTAFSELEEWAASDKKLFLKIAALVRDIQREPFSGLGKPEPLKYELAGFWSRRITDEHRLVYKIAGDNIIIASCKYPYKKK